MIIAIIMAKQLDVLLLGDDLAVALGARVQLNRLFYLGGCVFGICSGECGRCDGFVHKCSPFGEINGMSENIFYYYLNCYLGCSHAVAAEVSVAMMMTTNLDELPAGSITALIGAPFFNLVAHYPPNTSKSNGNQSSFRMKSETAFSYSAVLLTAFFCLIIALVFGLFFGNINFSLIQIIDTFQGSGNTLAQRVLFQLHLPASFSCFYKRIRHEQ